MLVWYLCADCTPCGNVSVFQIDSASGTITTNSPLVCTWISLGERYVSDNFFAMLQNREAIPQYVLTIFAVNNESDYQLSSTSTVTVRVIDVNDETPQFNQTLYENSISERTLNQSYILTVFATDGDEVLVRNAWYDKALNEHLILPKLMGNTVHNVFCYFLI